MRAWNGWYHVNGNTYGTWMHGDARGWRSRHGRDHPVGDYKNPPPRGMYERLDKSSRGAMKAAPVFLRPAQRAVGGREMVWRLLDLEVEMLALSLDRVHYHALARFPDSRVRHWMGLAKKHASFVLSAHGLKGRVWTRKCGVLPIRDRAHQVNVFHYVVDHGKKGAFVWTFRDPPPGQEAEGR